MTMLRLNAVVTALLGALCLCLFSTSVAAKAQGDVEAARRRLYVTAASRYIKPFSATIIKNYGPLRDTLPQGNTS